MKIDAVLEVEAGDPQIAIDFLTSNVNLSKSRLKDLMNKGGVWRVKQNGERERLRRAMTDIFVGEQIELFYDEALLQAKPIQAELLDDTEQYSVWQKPYAMPFHGDSWGDYNSFERFVQFTLKQSRPFVYLPSLDYRASGIVLLAHTRKAAAALMEQIGESAFDVAKLHYRADVEGECTYNGVCSLPVNGEPAETEIKTVKYDARPHRSVVDCWPKTGRPQQIAEQLNAIGHPIIGFLPADAELDELERPDPLRLKLVELSFICPMTGIEKHYSVY